MLCAPPKALFLFVLKIVLNHLSLLNLFTASSQHFQVEFELTAF